MSLDKVLHKHIDQMDSIEEAIQRDIDGIIASIDIDELIEDPHGVLNATVDLVKNRLTEKYIPLASKNGFDLAERIQQKDIKVDLAKDPDKNKEIIQ